MNIPKCLLLLVDGEKDGKAEFKRFCYFRAIVPIHDDNGTAIGGGDDDDDDDDAGGGAGAGAGGAGGAGGGGGDCGAGRGGGGPCK